MSDREQRALRLAVDTMWTYEQVKAFLAKHPNMTEDEAQVCLEVTQNRYIVGMFETLERAVGIFVTLEGEKHESSIVNH